MHDLAGQLLKTIRKHDSIRAGDRLAVAVSGGADSVALLCLLLELKAELGIVVSVAHVNHKLRGDESDQDARFVGELANQHGLELHTTEAPIAGNASGIEAAARELRYKFFRQLVGEGRAAKIATAHTLDDQAETVLLRMFRGTGIRGLSGIHPRIAVEAVGKQGLRGGEVVRPLLGFRRASLLDYLRECAQSWREDSSNRDDAFLRNRMRHRLLPIILEEFGDGAIQHMGELAEIARGEEEHWHDRHIEVHPEARAQIPGAAQTRQAASLQVRALLALSLAARRRFVRGWLEAHAPEVRISFRLIEKVLDLARESAGDGALGKRLELSGGRRLRSGRQELFLEMNLVGAGDTPDYEYVLAVPGVLKVAELGTSIEACVVQPAAVAEVDRGQLLDLGRMPKQVVIRNWRAGDRFWPAHTVEEKKVKELLSDRQATGTEKKLWPVAVAEGCGIVWLRGFPVPSAFRAPAATPKAIWIREITAMM